MPEDLGGLQQGVAYRQEAPAADTLELSLPAVEGAIAYRFRVRDETAEEDLLRLEKEEPHLSLPVSELDPSHRYSWRGQSRDAKGKPWVDATPKLTIGLPPAPGTEVTPLEWAGQGVPAYRVLIRDERIDEIVVKEAVATPNYLANWAELDPSHPHRVRIQVWRDGSWADLMPYRPLYSPVGVVDSTGSGEDSASELIELDWPGSGSAHRYRLILSDRATGEQRKVEAAQPRFLVPADVAARSTTWEWRIQRREHPTGPWVDVSPYLSLLEPKPEDGTEIEWPDQGAPAYRVLIVDDSLGEIVVKAGVRGTKFTIDWSGLDRHHVYRYRVQAWESGEWVDARRYAPLHPPLRVLREAGVLGREAAERRGGSGELLFLFTCDTEVNPLLMRNPKRDEAFDRHIFCRHGGRDYGIGYLMDTLDTYGFRGTFFLDVLMEYQFGSGTLNPIVEAIRGRGHDIQLHLHPSPHLRFSDDPAIREAAAAMETYDPDLFRQAFELALELFEKRVGEPPVAYRSGAYCICDEFFPVMSEFGIRVDSSVYPHKNCNVSPWMRTRTQPFWVGDVLEVPVSWMLDWRGAESAARQFAPYQNYATQPAFTAAEPQRGGQPSTLVYLAHSFSLLRREELTDGGEANRWREELAQTWPRPEVLARYQKDAMVLLGEPDQDRISGLERSLAALAERRDTVSLTLADFARDHLDRWAEPPTAVDPLPEWPAGAGEPRVTGLRRYTEGYLEQLEDSARAAEQPAG